MNFTVVIPARYDSQRLPGKALLDIAGKPMIQWVYEQAKLSKADSVVVATDDKRIADAVKQFGGEHCMTSKDHVSGTDRIQEVVSLMDISDDKIVVNVQGDEPLIPPEVINQVANNLNNSSASMATLCEKIESLEDLLDPNIVKVVSDCNKNALYFSRAAIPFDRDQNQLLDNTCYFRHVGIYAYRASLLNKFVTWAPDQIELIEKLEQLRVLRQGYSINVDESVLPIPPGVDTEKDLERTRAFF